MNYKKIIFHPKKRRGISSVVGALFFTVLMVAGFSVLSLALDAQTDIVTTQRVVSDIELKKQQERFGIAVSTNASNYLDISVTNLGQNPVGISSFWIINKTLADAPATRYEIDYDNSFVTGGSTTQILTSQTLSMVPDTYDIKVVSTLGTIEITELDVSAGGSSSNSLRSVLVTDPPDVILGQNVTIGMVVTNTGELPVTNVSPLLPTVNPPGAVTGVSGPNLSSVNLIPGESFLFLWDYTIDGTADVEVDFSNYATGIDINNNLVQSNIVSDTSVLREDSTGGSGGGGETIVIRDDLFGKPQLFLIFPGPVGWDNNDRALWGVNVANPTDQPLAVTKVVLVAMSPRATSSDKIFPVECHLKSSPLDPITVSPTSDRWTCPDANQLQWKDIANPQIIAPRSVFPFLVEIGSESIGSATGDVNNIPVLVTVSSTLGQFGKAGYLTTMNKDSVAMPNVYLSKVPGSTAPTNMLGEIRAITEGTVVKFNATLAEMNTNEHQIDSGSRLIINVPKDWTFNSISNHVGFNTPVVQTFIDGSTQIIGSLSSNLPNGAKSIEFTATAPNVITAKMYVMHILADGTATGSGIGGSYAVGPLSETVLQVCPTSGCP